jgi:YD repeat-containing protein
VSFMYDPFGRRIQKSSAAGTTNYVYDGANIVAEFDAAGTLVARYSQGQGIDQPAAYYNADGLGSITSLRDVNGSVIATYSYEIGKKKDTDFGITGGSRKLTEIIAEKCFPILKALKQLGNLTH